jgi:hypothetical protein
MIKKHEIQVQITGLCIGNYKFWSRKERRCESIESTWGGVGGGGDFWREIVTAGCSARILVAVFIVDGRQFKYCPLVLKLKGEHL